MTLAYDAVVARFGERLRELREQSGLSLAEAGERAGISRASWWQYESGKRGNPTLAQMQAMAAALNTTLLDLLEGVTPEDE